MSVLVLALYMTVPKLLSAATKPKALQGYLRSLDHTYQIHSLENMQDPNQHALKR